MDRGSSDKESDSSSISTFSFKSARSSTISSESVARFVDHFEIFRNQPEIIRFCFNEKDTDITNLDFRLEELDLDPYICGYLARGMVGTPKENGKTAYLIFIEKLKSKCHSHSSILDHGKIISVQYSDRLMTETEVETWRFQVVALFKSTDGVRSCTVSFPKQQENIDIVKRKLNHHLKERNVVAYMFSDPERVTEISFAYEGEPSDFLENLISDIKQQDIITKSETFEDQQMQVLKIRHKWWESVLVDIQTGDKTVQISGLQEDVDEAFFRIRKALVSANITSIPLDVDEAKLFQSRSAKKFVSKKMKSLSGQQHLDWLIDENVIRIIDPSKVSSFVECLKQCITSKTFSDVPEKVLVSKVWTTQVENLNYTYKQKLVITSLNGTIKVTSTSDIHKTVCIMVKNFLKRYTIRSQTTPYDCQRLDFFEEYLRNEMETKFDNDFLQVTRLSESKIRIDGTSQSIEEVRRVIDNISVEFLWVARQNVIDFVLSEEGNQLLKEVSKESGCFINTGQPVHIQLIKGKIEEQKVDVIVNSAAPDLRLNKGEVAKCLSRAAGAKLQEDILRQHNKGVPEGTVLKSTPGNLTCKSVYHVVLSIKITENKAIKKEMESVMKECLEMAVKDKYESLAFPVFGTGTLGYPPDVVANTMYDVIVNFALKSVVAANTVKKIMIILFPENKRIKTAFDAVQKNRSKCVNDCKMIARKLLKEPQCLLELFIRLRSDSVLANRKAVRLLEERLP